MMPSPPTTANAAPVASRVLFLIKPPIEAMKLRIRRRGKASLMSSRGAHLVALICI